MTGESYLATPYLRLLTPANGWHGELLRDRHGQLYAIVAVRVGARWTDSVTIEGEDRAIAVRHRTHGVTRSTM